MTPTLTLGRVARPAIAVVLAALAAACSDKTTAPPQPAAIISVGNTAIDGIAGAAAGAPLIVRVNDSNGNPVANQVVTFNVVDGGGTVSPLADTTDNQGRAQTNWTFGGTAGPQRAQALVAGLTTPVTFVAQVAPAAAATVAVNGGDNQTAAAGALVTTAPSIIVKDRFNNPVPNVSVFFTVSQGGGSVTTSGATTNAQGIASATGWRLGNTVGVNRLTALALVNGAAGNPVTFTATATAGAAASIAAGSATTSTVNAGAQVTPVPSIRITDAQGNPVQGVTVTFTGSAGSTVVGSNQTTDVNGVAAPTSWQLGTLAGNYTLTASSGSLTPVVFTGVARANAASSVTVASGNSQTAVSGRPVDIEPAVRVTDAFGNPIAGVEVVFDVITGGGFATGRRPVTNANGVATVGGWTLGETPGPNTLRATVNIPGLTNNTVTFTATGTAGAPSTVTIQGGNGQSAAAGSAVATPPSVLVRDNRGNPVAGVTVNFIVTGGGGAVLPATVTTNAQGIATATSWTLGNLAGAQTLVARVAGLPDQTFTATAVAGSPASVQVLSQLDFGTAVVNSLITPLPSVRVLDAVGNPIGGAVVNFVLDQGNTSTLTGNPATTNAQGVATLGSWRVGTIAGQTTTLRAFVTGLDQQGNEPAFFVRTLPAAGTLLAAATGSQTTQAGTAGAAVASVPAVRLTDAFGNAVAGVAVEFLPQQGTVGSGLVNTDANGVASSVSWTLPAGSGARTLVARLVNNPTVQVTFTANVP